VFGVPERILCEHSLDVKENDEHVLDVSHLLGLGEFGRFVYGSCFLP
jgi:hypothetical protein